MWWKTYYTAIGDEQIAGNKCYGYWGPPCPHGAGSKNWPPNTSHLTNFFVLHANQWHGHARTKAQQSKAASYQMGQTKVFMAGEPEFEDMKDQAQMFDQMHYLTKGFKIELKGLKNWMVRNVISSLWLTIKVSYNSILQYYYKLTCAHLLLQAKEIRQRRLIPTTKITGM